jgi:hypothetical protein
MGEEVGMGAVEWIFAVGIGMGGLGLFMACLSVFSQEIREWAESRKEHSTDSTPSHAHSYYDPGEFSDECQCVPPIATTLAAYSERDGDVTIILNEGLPSKTIMASGDLYWSFKSATKEVE